MKPRHSFYKSLREKIGTRKEVSKLLGVHQRTLERREDGQIKITDEMVAALLWNGCDRRYGLTDGCESSDVLGVLRKPADWTFGYHN